MRHFLIALLFSLLTFTPITPLTAHNRWEVEKLFPSIVKLEIFQQNGPKMGHCTAFSINEKARLYLTAYHCISTGVQYSVGKFEAYPVDAIVFPDGRKVDSMDVLNDLAVFIIPALSKPALKLGPEPKLGSSILGLGYGREAATPLFFEGLIINWSDDPWGIVGKGMAIFSINFIGGMSGGPIVDTNNRFVSIAQCGGTPGDPTVIMGCGASYAAVKALVKNLVEVGTIR